MSVWKILIVEDEKHIAEGIEFNLTRLGHQVLIAENGVEGLEKWKSFAPHLILLDIMLPKMDGHELLSRIRKEDPLIPILILSAKGLPFDRIKGLNLGADDYLAKPFELEELLLRIKKLIDRSLQFTSRERESVVPASPAAEDLELSKLPDPYLFGENTIELKNQKVFTAQGEIYLTEQEWKLLVFFLKNAGKTLDREVILESAWGYNPMVHSRTLDNFIVRFRRYFEKSPKRPEFFLSMRGRGYRFSVSA